MYEDVAKESTKGRKRKVDEAAHEDAWVDPSRTNGEAMEQRPPEGAANDEAMEDFRREIQLVEAMTDREAQRGETAEAERLAEEEEDDTSEDKELEERFVQEQLVDKVKELQQRRMKVPKRKQEAAPRTSEKQQEWSHGISDEDTESEEESSLLFDWRAKSLQQAKE